jgi:transposase
MRFEDATGVVMARYDMTDFEWSVIEPILPQKARGVSIMDDRRVLNGIFWVLCSGATWADLPERYGPPATCYNRYSPGSRLAFGVE